MRIGIVVKEGLVTKIRDGVSFKIYESYDIFYKELVTFQILSVVEMVQKVKDYEVEEVICSYLDNETKDMFKGIIFYETPEAFLSEALESYYYFKESSSRKDNALARSMAIYQQYPTNMEIEAANEIHDILYFDDDDIGGS